MRNLQIFAQPRTGPGRIAPIGLAVAVLVALVQFAFVSPALIGSLRAAELDGGPGEVTLRESATRQYVKIGLNKSLIVRLPRPARDILVGNQKIVDAVLRTAKTTYLLGKTVGQSNVFFFDAQGRQILNLEVQVERDLAVLKRMLRRLVSRNNIKLDSINDTVILTGTVSNSSEARRAADLAARFTGDPKKVLNMLTTAGKDQVLLKVSVVEMQRTVLKQLGVDLSNTLNIGSTVINLATANPFTLFGSPLSTTALAGTAQSGGDSVSATLRAMERNGLTRTLAEPTLTAISGESAKFLAGGEFPVPSSRDSDGNVVVEFKPFGVGLSFTPTVLSEGRISMKISTEVSETTSENAFVLGGATQTTLTVPGLRVRRAETTVELPSGGSMVMAGLIQETTKQNLNGVPGIKDIPVLGALFRSRDFQSAETELVVIVTPYIVQPTSRGALSDPDQNFRQANDAQTMLLGRLNKVYGVAGGALPNGKYHGSYGFIVE